MDTTNMWDYEKMTSDELANKKRELSLQIATLDDEIDALETHRDVLRDELKKIAGFESAPLLPVEEFSATTRLHFEGQGKPSPIRGGDIEVEDA